MPDPGTNYLVNRSYADFDALANEAQQWDLELRQLDAGPFHGEVTQFGIGNVHVSEARFGRTLEQCGAPPVGMRTIVVPGDRDVDFEWRGMRINCDSLMVFPQGAELAAISNSNFHIFTCSFHGALLDSVSESLEIAPLDDVLKKTEVIQCNGEHIRRIRHLLQKLCIRLTEDERQLGNPGVADCVTADLPQLLLRAAAVADHNSIGVAASKRMRMLKCAEEYIYQRADEPPTVREVCEAVQVSLRTLQYAFSEHYGISPKRYIRSFRLNLAHKNMRLADPNEQKVADVANRCGFWHMGQFAADYRKHFGELPSETLRRIVP